MMSSNDGQCPQSTSIAPTVSVLPPLDSSDPKAVLQRLIRLVMLTFYTPTKALVLDYVRYHQEVTERDLADRLMMTQKDVRSILQEMKRNKFIKEYQRREQKANYFSFDERMFINVVKYRLDSMRNSVESCQRQQIDIQSSFECEKCSEIYNENKILRLFNAGRGEFVCLHCDGVVIEDTTAKDKAAGSIARIVEFNEQLRPLFDVLKAIDILDELHNGWSTVEDEESMDIGGVSLIEQNEVSYTSKPMPAWFTEPMIYDKVKKEDRFATVTTQVAPRSFSETKNDMNISSNYH